MDTDDGSAYTHSRDRQIIAMSCFYRIRDAPGRLTARREEKQGFLSSFKEGPSLHEIESMTLPWKRGKREPPLPSAICLLPSAFCLPAVPRSASSKRWQAVNGVFCVRQKRSVELDPRSAPSATRRPTDSFPANVHISLFPFPFPFISSPSHFPHFHINPALKANRSQSHLHLASAFSPSLYYRSWNLAPLFLTPVRARSPRGHIPIYPYPPSHGRLSLISTCAPTTTSPPSFAQLGRPPIASSVIERTRHSLRSWRLTHTTAMAPSTFRQRLRRAILPIALLSATCAPSIALGAYSSNSTGLACTREYTVIAGDTCDRIGQKTLTSTYQIIANNLDASGGLDCYQLPIDSVSAEDAIRKGSEDGKAGISRQRSSKSLGNMETAQLARLHVGWRSSSS